MQFSPSVYEHAAHIIGRTPWEVSRDGELLYEAHATAWRRYHHSPIVVGVDIYNLEAEAYGATVGRPDGHGIPAISGHICEKMMDVLMLKPLDAQADGRIPAFLDVAERLARDLPEADVRVPVSGPFSIASNLVGFETLLMATIAEPEGAISALRYLAEVQVDLVKAIAKRGLDIAFFESAAAPPLISPGLFRDVELPALTAVIRGAEKAVGHPVPCVIGGDTLPILDGMLETGTGYLICPCETDQPAFMEAMEPHPEVMVRVNTRPEIVSEGNLESVYAEVDRVMELACSREKSCIGTGALPYETDPAVVEAMAKYIAEKA